MRVTVNGEARMLPAGASAADAAALVGVAAADRGVALAVDGAVVPKGAWATTALSEGCTVEVVRAAAGG